MEKFFLAGGVSDSSFTTYDVYTGINNTASSIETQSDGKIILVGDFTTFNEVTVNRIVRFNSDGTQDTGFTTNTGTGANSQVNTIAIQSDQKIIIGGNFKNFNGIVRNSIARLSGDFSG